MFYNVLYIEQEEAYRPLQTFDFCKKQMMRQLEIDSAFLCRHNVMDYSLIVAEGSSTRSV